MTAAEARVKSNTVFFTDEQANEYSTILIILTRFILTNPMKYSMTFGGKISEPVLVKLKMDGYNIKLVSERNESYYEISW